MGSVGSQSSGYSSGELANRGVASGQQASHVTLPFNVYNAMTRQHYNFNLLLNCLDLWDQAQSLVTDKNRGECLRVSLDSWNGVEEYTVEKTLFCFCRFFCRAG